MTSSYSEVDDQRTFSERFIFNPVHGNVGQRYVSHGVDRERVPLDRTERAVGDRK